MARETSNPAFKDAVISQVINADGSTVGRDGVMTMNGTIAKTTFLTTLLILSTAFFWIAIRSGSFPVETVMPIAIGAMIVQVVMSILIIRKPHLSARLSIIYAVVEGVVLGFISALFEMRYPGIVLQASLGTVGVLMGMLFLYRTKLIVVTENFRLIVASATMGIAFMYLISMVMNMFGSSGIRMIHEGSTMGMVFSVFVISLAAMNLALDFDFIEKSVEARAPKYMEWYGAFGLMITLIWIYIEILRMLGKGRSRD